jgi:hypothetical protein
MATSPYFNNYNAKYDEQRLVEDLITESIQIMGFNAYYLPNDNDAARDLIYGEDPVKKFKAAFPLEMYLSSANDYMGEKEMFTKFGLEIRNQVTVILSKRAFTQRVPQNTYTRPREGDLVYIPFLNGTGELYEIKFTNQNKDFFMLGRKVPYYYELELEKFKYSQEIISTGNQEIDSVVTDSAYTLHLNTGAGTGNYNIKELVYQSTDGTYANATTIATVQSWISSSNTLSVTNIAGEFIDGQIIIGQSSNARYTLATFDPLFDPANKESYDNEIIQTTASPYVNTSESNPIGGL